MDSRKKSLKRRATISNAYSIGEIYSKERKSKGISDFVLDDKAYKKKKKICKELEIEATEKKEKILKPSHINKQGKALKNMINIYMEEVLNDNLLNENNSKFQDDISQKNKYNSDRINFKYSSHIIGNRGKKSIFGNSNNNDRFISKSVIGNFDSKQDKGEVNQETKINENINRSFQIMVEDRQISPETKMNKKKIRRIFRKDYDNEEARKVVKIQKVEDSISNDEEELENNIDYESVFFIYPESTFKYFWDWIMILIMFYSLIFIPYFIAFGYYSLQIINIIEISNEILLIVDLICNFFVVTQNFEEKNILNHRIICLKYLKGYFIIDLISSVPISLFIYNLPSNIGINLLFLKFLKFLKLYKILGDELTLIDFNQISLIDQLNMNSSIKRLVDFAISFLITSHILTCCFISLTELDDSNWINFNDFRNDSKFSLYITSIYFIWQSILTIGYGDVLTVNLTEKIFNVFLLAFGVVIYSFGVTSLSSLITNLDIETAQYYKNIELVEDIRKKYENISQELIDKILKYLKYEYKFNNTSKFGLISELPSRTRNSLLYAMYRKMIINFSFFSSTKRFKNDDFNTRIVLCMRPIRLTKSEIILKEGEIAQEMFLIKHGALSVTYNRTKLFDLGKNDHFGDVLMMGNKPSPLEIKVKSKTCEMLIIKKQELIQIWKEFPMILDEIFEISSENYNRIISMIEDLKKKQEQKELLEKNNANLQNQTLLNETHEENFLISQKEIKKLEIFENIKKLGTLKKKDKKIPENLFLIPEQPTLCEKSPTANKNEYLISQNFSYFVKKSKPFSERIYEKEINGTIKEKKTNSLTKKPRKSHKFLTAFDNKNLNIVTKISNFTIFGNKSNFICSCNSAKSNDKKSGYSNHILILKNQSFNSSTINSLTPIKIYKGNSIKSFSPIKEGNSKKTKQRKQGFDEFNMKNNHRKCSQFTYKNVNTLNQGLNISKIKNINSLNEKRKSNIFERVNKHLMENINMEVNPIAFMQNEFEKINKKVIGESTSEMEKILGKLDLIMNNLNKKK